MPRWDGWATRRRKSSKNRSQKIKPKLHRAHAATPRRPFVERLRLRGGTDRAAASTTSACRPRTCPPRCPRTCRPATARIASWSWCAIRTGCTVYWELTRNAIQRAEAALGQEWHGAKPILRLLDVTQPRHDQHRRIGPARHRHPRRLQQLVHRRRQPATLLPRRHRLSGAAAASSTSWPAPTSSPRRAPASATSSTRTGPTSTPRRPTASTPCPAASIRRRQQSGTQAAVRGAPAPADGLARRHQLRLRRLAVRQASASSGSSSTPN